MQVTDATEEKARDDEILSDSWAAYDSWGLPRALAKAYTRKSRVVAWGTEVNGRTGRVGTDVTKTAGIAYLTLQTWGLRSCTKKAMQRLVGLHVNPFMHRRSSWRAFPRCISGWKRRLNVDWWGSQMR